MCPTNIYTDPYSTSESRLAILKEEYMGVRKPSATGYILVCDLNKYASLVEPISQVPNDKDTEPEFPDTEVSFDYTFTYVKTNFRFGMPGTPVRLYPGAKNEAYIAQTSIKTFYAHVHIGEFDLSQLISTEEEQEEQEEGEFIPPLQKYGTLDFTRTAYVDGIMGIHSYYPGVNNLWSVWDTPDFKTYYLPSLTTSAYNTDTFAINVLNVDGTFTSPFVDEWDDTVKHPDIPEVGAPSIVAKTLLSDRSLTQGYADMPYTGTDGPVMDAGVYESWHKDYRADERGSFYSYSICYPLYVKSAPGTVFKPLLDTQDSVSLLQHNPQYKRCLFRAFNINSFTSEWSINFTPPIILGYTLIALSASDPTWHSTHGYTNTECYTDKHTNYSYMSYTNVDTMFCDIFDGMYSSGNACLWHQLMPHSRGTFAVRFKRSVEPISIIYSGSTSAAGTSPFTSTTDTMFYSSNDLTPEEYVYSDGFFCIKHRFLYENLQATPRSYVYNPDLPITTLLMHGFTLSFDDALYDTAYEYDEDVAKWKLTPPVAPISGITHCVNNLNTTTYRAADFGDEKDYTASGCSPHDFLMGEAEFNGVMLDIPVEDECLLGVSSETGLVDRIIDNFIQQAITDACDGIGGVNSTEYSFDYYSVVLTYHNRDRLEDMGRPYQRMEITYGGSRYIYYDASCNISRYYNAAFRFSYTGRDTSYRIIKTSVTATIDATNVFFPIWDNMKATPVDFPFGGATSTVAVLDIKGTQNGASQTQKVPLVLDRFNIETTAITQVAEHRHTDDRLSFPKIHRVREYLFTHTDTEIIMMSLEGVELSRSQLNYVKVAGGSHYYIDKFDVLLDGGFAEYMIAEYEGTA